jgi:hypothetical protein
MADAECLGSVGLVQYLLQSVDSAAGLLDSYRPAAKHRHAGRVVTTIFQPLQPFYKDRLGCFFTKICYYATHLLFTIRHLLFIIDFRYMINIRPLKQ